ncbi:T9SS type A sorting domain-containing protein [Flavobacterium agricola]|uniref:T9SS type A sorting domain-containing protein n=1 Tax=Flavobacterium agricola TaxID=2870839 RepID=A0ABY6LXW4_9FLAO|nr:zinc-dependent metalloprotease family protein [Flavobacterium agricola]UYW01174.1 T9SS type A sorting domain-containing protein [Flavobacterium agricola]
MRKFIFYFLIGLLFSVSTAFGQTNPWKSVRARKMPQQNELLSRPNMPNQFQILNLDAADLKKATDLATPTNLQAKRSGGVLVSMPTPDGDFITFEIFEQQDLAPELAKKFPNLKSYTGYSPYDKATEINFTVNALGFNGIITSPNFPSIYIDSYSKDLNQYLIYYRTELGAVKNFQCLDETVVNEAEIKKFGKQPVKKISDGVLRDYRLAIATTAEYSTFHIERAGAQNKTDLEKKEVVLSAIQTSINRVNAVYKRDLAIHFTLVANNDAIISLAPNFLNNNNANILISQSQIFIDNEIGFNNYDIGHTFSTGAGGLAQLNVPCSPYKAMGVTGSSQPVNDPYDIDYVSHEIGHQFGATHTFNNACGDNQRETTTAFEPGSGSTIMAYAGICAPNVAANSDDFFHYASIVQMLNYVENFGTCSLNTTLTNSVPQIGDLPNYVIPKGTPFKLTANATDADSDVLTYVWDQLDNEIVPQPSLPTTTSGPAFKSIKPTTTNTRYFPNYQAVLQGDLAPSWEILPTVPRMLNFGLTVRDNNPEGGLIAQKEMAIQVADVGPFVVTSIQGETTSWATGSTQTLTWDVAGTDSNGINATTVNILLSTDGGLSYEMLKENTPNDGVEELEIPDVLTKDARIMVEANNNIFYALSNTFSIGYRVIVEDFCNDYVLAYNGSEIVDANRMYNFIFNVNESEDFDIRDMKLQTNITATRTADVNVYFENANEVQDYPRIVFRNLACRDNANLITTFQNSGTPINCNLLGANSVLKPVENFTAVGNLKANGAWTVSVSKNTTNSTVKVNRLVLTLCGQKRTYLELDENLKTEPFAIYPNPSNGIFNFYVDTTNDIKVTIFDMTGKLILNKTYNSTTANVHDVNLAMLAKGVYIFKVDDGKTKRSKKIVIN